MRDIADHPPAAVKGIKIDMLIAVVYDENDKCYYAFCPWHDTIRDGQSPDEAVEYFKDAFEIMIKHRLQSGTLEKYLRKTGYHVDISWKGAPAGEGVMYFRRFGGETSVHQSAEKRHVSSTIQDVQFSQLGPYGDIPVSLSSGRKRGVCREV